MKVLEVSNLTKYYGKKRGVEDVSFSLEKGEIFGFIGPNGAGKSTVIRTILGLIKKNDGTIKIFEQDSDGTLVSSLKKIGYLPSETFFYDKLTAKKLLNYSAGFYGKEAYEKIEELADYFELDLSLKIHDMSLGNRKKVGIIQGLIHSPELLILDEPTSGLDPLMQQKFFSMLKKVQEEGTTILFSSHILGEVQKLCNRIAIIREGKIIKIQNIEEQFNYKEVSLTTQDEKVEDKLGNENIANIVVNDGHVNFIYAGEMNSLISLLKDIDLKDLKISEPNLEEVFMHYYE